MRTTLRGLLLALAALTVGSAPAYAHAAYEASDPANGTTLSSPPTRVTADFTEPVIPESRLEVYDPCGARVDNGDSLVASDRITVSMQGDKQGTYTVTFAVVSAVDGHPTNGEFSFIVSQGASCAAPEEDAEAQPEESEPRETEPDSSDEPAASDDQESPRGGGTDGGTGSGQKASGAGTANAPALKNTRGLKPILFTEGPAGSTVEPSSVKLAQAQPTAPEIGSDMPLTVLGVALLIAVIIGACGGVIYDGINFPR